MLLPGQLQKQAFRQAPGAHARRVQALQRLQSLGDEGLGDFQFLQSFQVLGGQVAVLVHQLRHVFAQGQQGLGQPPAVQLVAEKSGKAFRLPVHGASLRVDALLMGKGGAVDAAVQPACLLPKLFVGVAQVGGVLLLQHGVFLRDPVQVFQQLLGVHLQDFHRLQKLGRQLQLLPQLGF